MREAQKDSPSSVNRGLVRQVLLSAGPAHHACHVQKQVRTQEAVIFKANKAEARKCVGDPISIQPLLPVDDHDGIAETDYRKRSESIIVLNASTRGGGVRPRQPSTTKKLTYSCSPHPPKLRKPESNVMQLFPSIGFGKYEEDRVPHQKEQVMWWGDWRHWIRLTS